MNIAFIYNLYYQDSDVHPDFFLEIDADGKDTINSMINYFEKDHKVYPIEANVKAYDTLRKNKKIFDLVFNYSIGIYGEDRYAHFPAILELLRIPYTGSGPLTQALVLNKAKMQEMLSVYGIKTPRTIPVSNLNQIDFKKIVYPTIIKPSSQGSSAGITSKSIVYSKQELIKQIKYVISNFRQEALIQPFIIGREITVSMLGNPPVILPLAEFNFKKMPKNNPPFLPYEWDIDNFGQDFIICPAKIKVQLESNIKKIVMGVWKALNIKDYCRIDLRINSKNKIFVIDVNSPPSLIPPNVILNDPFPLSAKKAGLTYQDMLNKIISVASERHKLKKY